MKPISIVSGIAAGLVLAVSVIFAQGSSDEYPFTKGQIVKLDVYAKQVLVKTPHGPVVFVVNDQTYLISNQLRVGFEKLNIGDNVKLNYFTNEIGQAFIRRLKVIQPNAPANPQK